MYIHKKYFYNKRDITSQLGCSNERALKIIRQLNEELQKKNFFTYRGVVPVKYFRERFNLPVIDYEEVKVKL